MDIIYISQLRVETVIGVYEWERHIRQVVLLDLEMATDVARAAATDNMPAGTAIIHTPTRAGSQPAPSRKRNGIKKATAAAQT